MSRWRLSTLTSGQSRKLAAAAIPVPAVDAGAKNSRERVFGNPGTLAIYAPAPFPVTDRSLAAQANEGFIGLPSSTPGLQVWYPSLYWVNSHEHAPVSVVSDTQMPVPAIDPRLQGHAGVPGPLGQSPGALGVPYGPSYGIVMPGPVIGGQKVAGQPRVTPKYLNRIPQGTGRRRGY